MCDLNINWEEKYLIQNNDSVEKILKKFDIRGQDIKNISTRLKFKKLSNIYAGRENPIPGITAELISNKALEMGHKNVKYIQNKENIPNKLLDIVNPNDIIITMGAGDIWRQCKKIYEVLNN